MDILAAFNICDENHNVNIQGTSDNPLFQANQIGKILGYSRIRDVIIDYDDDEKVADLTRTLGGEQEVIFLTENGLYKLLFRTNKPIAKTFQKWVFNIIKEIRKNGKYELENILEHEAKLNESRIEYKKHETLVSSFDNKNVVYLTKLKKIDNDYNIIKVGWTDNIDERNRSLGTKFGMCIFQEVYEVVQNQEFELFLKRHPDINKHAYREYIFNDNKSIETYKLTNNDLNNIIKIIKKNIIYYQGFNPEQYIEIKKINLEFEKLKIENEKNMINTKLINLLEKSENLHNIVDTINIIKQDTIIKTEAEIEAINNIKTKEEIEEIKKSIYTKTIIRKDKVDKLTEAVQFKPRVNTRQNKVQQYDKNTLKLIKTFDGIMDVIRTYNHMSLFGIRSAAKNNTEYNDYRWFFIKRDDKDIEYDIPETVQILNSIPYRIAKLNISKTKIEGVYLTLKEAADSENITRKQTILDSINSEKPYKKKFYFMKYEFCSEKVKKEYLSREELPEYTSSGTVILQLDIQTKEIIKKFNSINDVLKHVVISRSILQRACNTQEPQNGFIWRYEK